MGAFLKLVHRLENHPSQFLQLGRHFFGRFFDHELVSRNAEAQVTVTQILALLAAPGLLGPLLLFPRYARLAFQPASIRDMAILFDKCLFLSFGMAIMGFITVFEWDALFPDPKDYVVLTPLPIKIRTIFAAKVSALCLFLVCFGALVNALTPVLYPAIVLEADPQRHSTLYALSFTLAHATAAYGGCAFIFCFFVALHGLLSNLLSARKFKQVTPYVQLVSMAGLLSVLLLFPRIMSALRPLERHNDLALCAFPPMWFLGLYETILGRTQPVFRSLAGIAVAALGAAFAAAVAAYAISYRRHARRSLETTNSHAAGPAMIERALTALADRFLVRNPLERATFYFVGKTLLRSRKHKLYLAGYAGVGFALVIDTLVAVFSRRGYAGVYRPSAALLSMPLVLSFFILLGMRIVFAIPAEPRANWVFQLTECERRKECLAGARKAMIALGMGPLLAALLPLYGVFWGWRVASLQLVFDATLSLILMELLLLNFRKIPFTCTYVPGKAHITTRWIFYWMAFSTFAYGMASLEYAIFESAAGQVIFFGVAFSVLAGLIAYRNYLLDRGFTLMFEDEPEPVVQTLNLSP